MKKIITLIRDCWYNYFEEKYKDKFDDKDKQSWS